MKRIFIHLFCILLSGLGGAEISFANHMTGGEITYAAVPGMPNQYIVTVKLYRDCSGDLYPDTSITLEVFSPSGCGAYDSVQLNRVPGTGIGNEIATSPHASCPASTCHGGTGYGIEEWVYSGLVVLSNSCPDWVLSYSDCCRNAALNTATPGYLYVETTLDNTSNHSDSSPIFAHIPVINCCVGRIYQLDMRGADPNGDSLIYTLQNAWEAPGADVNYLPPYSGTYPIASNPPPSLNPLTGFFTFSPTMAQVGVFSILVECYGRTTGLLIGTIRRDIQIHVDSVCNDPPLMDSTYLSFNNLTALCYDTVLHLKFTWQFQCNSLSPDGTDFRLLKPTGIPILISAAISHNCNSLGLSDSLTLFLRQGLDQNGTYKLLSKQGYDGNTLLNACGDTLPEYDTCSFTFNNCFVGIEEIPRSLYYLEVYPNPAHDFLAAKTNMRGTKEMNIFNTAGQKVRDLVSSDLEFRVEVTGLADGVYSLEMRSEKRLKRVFFVIKH